MISGVTVKSLIHFQLTFEWCKKWVQLQFFFFTCEDPIFSAPLIEKTHLHWVFLAPLSPISWPYRRGFISVLSSVPLVYLSVFRPVLVFWWLYNIAWNHEVWYLLLCFSFSGFLWLLWVFCGFIYILRVFFSCEKCHWTLDRDCNESVDSFWQ